MLKDILKATVKTALESMLQEVVQEVLAEVLGTTTPTASTPTTTPTTTPTASTPRKRAKWEPPSDTVKAIAERLADKNPAEERARIVADRARRLGEGLGRLYLEKLQEWPVEAASRLYKLGIKDLQATMEGLQAK